ncbi:MAG: efflux RND transporter periplasmic adaptor subunit [Phycisphaeraceae bacterium]
MSESQHTSSTPPPRGPALWKIAAVVVVLAAGLVFGVWISPAFRAATRGEMDNAVAQVDLALDQKLIGDEEHDKVVNALRGLRPEVRAQYYTCGMHPWVVLPQPGDCPICGMKLVPLDPAKFTGEVTINPVVARNIGVRVSPVTTGPLVKTLRTVGGIDYDETRLYDVNIKTPGWIEKLYVDQLGQPVRKGDALFDLYSPELYAAQDEYLAAAAAKGEQGLLNAARTRLRFFDISDEQIAAMEQRGKPEKTLRFTSPADGVVIAKQAVDGMKVDAGMQVYRIADLSRVWVMVTLYEDQLPYVTVGQEAVMSLSYIPGQAFAGKVVYIYPYLDKKTRQITVRLAFDNPTGLLKPGMFATVEIHSTLATDRTLAPRSAIIDTGERQVAFVSLGDGKFEPRDVKTGVQTENDQIEIIDGLKPGEMVVTSGQFLIDSEARMRESLAKMIKGDLAADQKATAATTGPSEIAALPDDAAKALNQLLTHYLNIQSRLAGDSTADMAGESQAIAQTVDDLLKVRMRDEHFWHQHTEVATVRGKALELTRITELKPARQAFADLSTALNKLLLATGVPPTFGKEVEQLHCPMFRAGQGGTTWLQIAGEVRNPYFGSTMLGCFDARHALPVTGPSTPPEPPGKEAK